MIEGSGGTMRDQIQPDRLNKDLYEILGVAADASTKDISKAYKRLAKSLHPDINPGDTEAEERFKAITDAYDILGDEDKRAQYDEFQKMVGDGFTGEGFGGYGGPGAGQSYGGASSMEDLLSQMFGGAAGGFGGGPGGSNFGGRPTAMAALTIPFETAVNGGDISVQTADGPLTVRIPAGADSGTQLLAPGPNGDLLIELTVAPHSRFGRSGVNLTIEVPLSVTEAALGTRLKVPTFGGKPVTLKVPAGTPAGRTFRVSGRGVNANGKKGDLLVTVQVHVPTDLTDDQQKAMEALAAVLPTVTHPNRA